MSAVMIIMKNFADIFMILKAADVSAANSPTKVVLLSRFETPTWNLHILFSTEKKIYIYISTRKKSDGEFLKEFSYLNSLRHFCIYEIAVFYFLLPCVKNLFQNLKIKTHLCETHFKKYILLRLSWEIFHAIQSFCLILFWLKFSIKNKKL